MLVDIIIYLVIFLYGVIVGSFLNVCILRIPLKETIVSKRSHCMSCGHQLAWYDLFPLFSYLFLPIPELLSAPRMHQLRSRLHRLPTPPTQPFLVSYPTFCLPNTYAKAEEKMLNLGVFSDILYSLFIIH